MRYSGTDSPILSSDITFDSGFEGSLYFNPAFVITIGDNVYLAFDGYYNNTSSTIFYKIDKGIADKIQKVKIAPSSMRISPTVAKSSSTINVTFNDANEKGSDIVVVSASGAAMGSFDDKGVRVGTVYIAKYTLNADSTFTQQKIQSWSTDNYYISCVEMDNNGIVCQYITTACHENYKTFDKNYNNVQTQEIWKSSQCGFDKVIKLDGDYVLFSFLMDGVYCMVSGMYSIYPTPLCIVGGNCSVTGIDAKGEDKFWTVLGGNAICMTLFDVNEDGYNELVVGTDDFAIRFYQNENVINEINENTKIINVAVIEGFKFVYALENGTVGLRNSTDRLWKMKENGYVTAIVIDDFNKDNIYEILLGWSNGKIQLLAQEKGKILIEFDVQQPLSTILFGSLTSNEEDHLVALTQKGEVFGYKYCEELDGDTETQFVSKDKGVSPQDLQRYNS